jgi:hypothetical protein
MDIYETLFSSAMILNEQIARELFAETPETGPILTILDTHGNHWSADEIVFEQVFQKSGQLEQICRRIDDSGQPVISMIDDWALIASELNVKTQNCGYIFLFLPDYSPEMTMQSLSLVELLFDQIETIAALISKNNKLHTEKLKTLSSKQVSSV